MSSTFTSTLDKTAWGSLKVEVADQVLSGLPTVYSDLGYLDINSFNYENSEGERFELMDENRQLIDALRMEGNITINFDLIKPTETVRSKFWDMEETGSDETRQVKVKSFVNNTTFVLKLSNPKAVGSAMHIYPAVKINMSPFYEVGQGWKAKVEVSILKDANGVLFHEMLVPAPAND